MEIVKKRKEKWIIVKNKITYLFLLVVPIGIAKILLYDVGSLPNISELVFNIFVSIMLMIIGISFFVKFNTYSYILNPDHPKPKDS